MNHSEQADAGTDSICFSRKNSPSRVSVQAEDML